MFSVFEYFLIIFSIIVGEKTSFSLNNDASRLSEGLKSRSPIFQYLASQDFADVSKDPKAHRRGFIYRDDGIMFSQIVKTFTQTIDDICRINTIEPSKANSIAQTDRLIPSLIKFYNDVIKDQKSFGKSSFQLFIEFPFITLPKIYRRYTSSRNSLMMKKKSEYSVVSKSYVVMNEIEALTTLMFKAADEDKVGIIQVHAETILKSLLKLHCALGKNANRQWVTPPFAPISKTVYNMNAFDYKELLNYVLEITDWALRELLLTDQMNFDFSLVGEEYKETIDGIKKIYADIN
ncbi:hypothetical protein GPJ56_001782 [Histomonas meleagridis]|uniref:uncharacterized protein n=1 Tax=Histomonas meleagridis TaxID=135588 RepID=UPI00355A824F|nr:hypothetical protein GPJ56_001782 [Histomonas meleagridis]KAH0806556.1 hypothetical protein GO595_000718 [Histomonas meleagridis]